MSHNSEEKQLSGVAWPSVSSRKRLYEDENDNPRDQTYSQKVGSAFKRPRTTTGTGEKNGHSNTDGHDGTNEEEYEDWETKMAKPKPLRMVDKKLLRRDNPNHWVLQESAAFDALRALEEICAIPSFSSGHAGDLHLDVTVVGDFFTAKLNSITVSCIHQPTKDSIAYGGCAVLSFLDLYWSPLLGCVVAPQRQSILLYMELKEYIMNYAKMENNNPHRLLEHIANSFGLNQTNDISQFYQEKCQDLVLQYPIPGLSFPEKRYQCIHCNLWYSSQAQHAKKDLKCPKTKATRQFSIPLYPPSKSHTTTSCATEYRIKLAIPDHRTFSTIPMRLNRNYRKKADEQPPLPSGTKIGTVDSDLIQGWMKPGFANRTGPLATKLQENKNGFHFLLDGQLFCCMHLQHSPKSDSAFYTGCAVLSFFQLFFSPVLGAIVSPRNRTLLSHHTTLRTLASRKSGLDPQILWNHLLQSFNLLDDAQNMFEKIHCLVHLDNPILGLEEPKLVYQCTHCGSSFDARQSATNYHRSQHHPLYPKITVTQTYAIRLWDATAKRRYQVTMSQCWIDSHEQEMPHNRRPTRIQNLTYSDENATHLNGSGFREHFGSWNADLSAIIGLVSLRSAEELWSINSLGGKSERCIVQVHRLVKVYLSEAEQRVKESPFLRRAVTSLHFPIPTKFNPIKKDSLTSHCSYLTRLFAIVLRYCVAVLGQDQFKGQDQNRCKFILKQLGSFRPLLSSQQTSIIQNFLSEVHKSNIAIPDANVLMFIHEFLVNTFNGSYSVTDGVASVLEQTILVLNLSEDTTEIWRSAGWMYGVISIYFRIAKWTLVHAAVLGGEGAKYKQLLSISNSEDTADAPEELHPEIERHLDIETISELLSCEIVDEEPEIDGELVKMPCTSIISKVRSLSRLIDPKDSTCVYGRLHRLRQSVQRIARTEPFSSRVIWRDFDSKVAISWAFMEEQLFSISDIRYAAFQGVEKLNQACRQLFPDNLWDRSLSSLSLASFTDDWDVASMFECPRNAAILAPLITQLRAHLIKAIKCGDATLPSVLERPQIFLRCFAIALYLTAGIPPYARQTVALRYAADATSNRNFMLMNGTHGVFIWRTALNGHIGYRTKGSDTVWHIPSQATLPLILYLGVFRPVEMDLLAADALKTKSGMIPEQLSTHIFCNPLKRRSAKSITWHTDCLEETLKTGPLKMEAFPHRLLFSSIIERKHAQLLRTVQQPSVLDVQGQHTSNTSKRNYAVLQLQHSTGIHFSGYTKQLLVCQALHSSCFLTKPIASEELPGTLTGAPEDLNTMIHRNQSYALNVARNATAIAYSIASTSPERAAVISRAAYSKITFSSIISFDKSQIRIGHDAFLPIVNSLAYGAHLTQGNLRSYFSDQDSLVRLTASAATLVLAALSEWFNGKLEPYAGDVTLFSGKWKELVDDFTAEILLVMEQELPIWQDYMCRLSEAGQVLPKEGENISDIPLPPI